MEQPNRRPIKVVVTQYTPTMEWLRSKPQFRGFEFFTTFKSGVGAVERLAPGDIVCGSFSHILASAICKRGAEYWHIHVRKKAFKNPDYVDASELDRVSYVTRYHIEFGQTILQPKR